MTRTEMFQSLVEKITVNESAEAAVLIIFHPGKKAELIAGSLPGFDLPAMLRQVLEKGAVEISAVDRAVN